MTSLLRLLALLAFVSAVSVADNQANAQDDNPPPRPEFRMQRIVSPEIHTDNRVTFRLMAPGAESVSLSGDWMEGWGASEPLVKSDSGLWELTVGPLESELHGYSYVVDGLQVLDPSNPLVRRDGMRNASSLLIEGGRGDLYAVKDVPHGVLSKVWYDSPALGIRRQMYVYTPPGYEAGDARYPVLYLLHGGGGDEDAWTTLGRAPQILDNLIARGEAHPMMVIMTNGNPDQAAAPGEAPSLSRPIGGDVSSMGSGRFEESLIGDVIPFVEKTYRTLPGRENRAVSGLSMGGVQTLNLSFDHTDTFAYYGVMSMGIAESGPGGRNLFPDVDEKIQRLRDADIALYWVGCGEQDFLWQACNTLHAKLNQHGVDHEYHKTSGGHTWREWRIYLSELAPQLFR